MIACCLFTPIKFLPCIAVKSTFQIAKFVKNIDSQFRLLNLKNDSLRKRFDALKYDLQKCDQVVYDLTIRGMVPKDFLGKGDGKRPVCGSKAESGQVIDDGFASKKAKQEGTK